MLVETVLGPVWVWLAIGEEPAPLTFVGGGIIVITLIGHSLLALKAKGRGTAVMPAEGSIDTPNGSPVDEEQAVADIPKAVPDIVDRDSGSIGSA